MEIYYTQEEVLKARHIINGEIESIKEDAKKELQDGKDSLVTNATANGKFIAIADISEAVSNTFTELLNGFPIGSA